MKERLKKLRGLLTDGDAYLMFNPADIRYFSGMKSSNIALLITDKKQFVFSDGRYLHMIQSQDLYEPILLQTNLIAGVCETAAQLDFKRMIIEPSDILYSDFQNLQKLTDKELICGNHLPQQLRIVKDAEEILCLKQAQAIAEKAYLEVLNEVRPGNTSNSIAAKLDYLMRLYGSEEPAFDTIVVSGEDTIHCHGVPNDRPIKEGDFLLFDFGATKNGYRSDMTRTVGVGFLTDEQVRLYQTVLDAHFMALDAIKPGVEACVPDQIARSYMLNKGYPEFLHSLGHGVGLDIHEAPTLSTKSSSILQSGMVVTIEPGLYRKGVGGVRIEDMVVVTDTGFSSFPNIKKELIIL